MITVDIHEGGKGIVTVKFEKSAMWSKSEINAANTMMIKQQRILRNDIRRKETKQRKEAGEAQVRKDQLEKDRIYKEMADAMFERPKSKSQEKRIVIQSEIN